MSTPTELPPRFAGVDVQIIGVTQSDGQMTTRLRLYNGGAETLNLMPDDIWLALGYAPEPPGPRTPSEGMTALNLLPGSYRPYTRLALGK